MQISRIQSTSFGCNKCNAAHRECNNTECKISSPVKQINVSGNLLLTTLLGLLAGCQTTNDTYTIVIDKNGPAIYNQDGDCMDITPPEVFEKYQNALDEWDKKSPKCTISKEDILSDVDDSELEIDFDMDEE